ncbi:MAG: maleylpyruvate isomerase family mycothiol-dependent enzyme [Chloroflexota bacterium]
MNQVEHGPTAEHYIDAVRANSSLLADAAQRDLKAPVPTCPGWSVATLVAHIGEVQRFWALQIATRAQQAQELPDSAFDTCPGLRTWLAGVDAGTPDLDAVPPGLVAWFTQATADLVDAFHNVDPEEPVWHWSGDNRAIVHMRNQAMEATVHRWDAQNALGVTSPVDPAIALDGIDQHFEVQIAAARRWGNATQGQGETYHFHCTDGDGEWLVRFQGDDVTVRREHARGDIAIRGSGEHIFLWLWGRIPADQLDVRGDTSLLDRYRALVPPPS